MGRELVEVALHHVGPDGLETRSSRDDTHRRGLAGASRARGVTTGLEPADSGRPGRFGPGRAATRPQDDPRGASLATDQGLSYPTRCRTPYLDHSFKRYRYQNETEKVYQT
jgi:hypothetical protein